MHTPTSGDTVPARLRRRAAERPHEVALAVLKHQTLTYREWWVSSAGVAAGLLQLDVKPGDRVVLPCDNADTLPFAIAYVAVQFCGGVAVPVMRSHGETHLAQIVAKSGAVGLIGREKIEGIWCRTLDELVDNNATAEPEIQALPGAPAEILFTSGTTGVPKGVLATHANLLFTHGGSSDRPLRTVFHAIPPGTNAGQTLMLLALHRSPHEIVTVTEFNPRTFLAEIEAARPDQVVLTPTHADALLRRPNMEHDLSSVSLVRSVSAPISAATLAGLSKLFSGSSITSMYTTTEGWPAYLIVEYDPDRPTSLGKPRGETGVRIVDAHMNEVPPGQLGEVQLRSATPSRRSYDGDPDATRSVFLPTGWVRTGDIGKVDADGHLYFTDRHADLVISGGLNISTLEVEQAAKEFPGVKDAAAFGLSHPILGQVIALAATGRLRKSRLQDFLFDRLGSVKAPKAVFLVREIPRNALGKPLKAELRARFASHYTTSKRFPAVLRQFPARFRPFLSRLLPVPRHLLESVTAIWAEALERDSIPPETAFTQLGGASFDAANVVSAVAEKTGRAIRPRAVFEARHIRAFARLVANAPAVSKAHQQSIPRAPRRESWEG